MSLSLTPGPGSWTSAQQVGRMPSIRAGDTAERTFDMSIPLSVTSDTIVSITSITVIRVDGQLAGTDDLTIGSTANPPAPDTATATQVVFWCTAGITLLTTGSVNYQLTFTVVTKLGQTLVRDGYIAVTAPLMPSQ